MEKSPFQLFIELITFDKKFCSFEKSINAFSEEIMSLEKEKGEIDALLFQLSNHVYGLKKDVDAKELEMRDLDAQEKDKRSHLDYVANDREYQSLKREAESLKKKQHEYENVLLAAWNIYENAKKEYEKKEKEFEKRLEEIRIQLSEKQEKTAAIQKEIDQLDGQRQSKQEGIPSEWLEHYSRMRNSVLDPVVEIMDGSCSACFYTMPQQDVLKINKNNLVQCKGCYRFLYKKNEEGAVT